MGRRWLPQALWPWAGCLHTQLGIFTTLHAHVQFLCVAHSHGQRGTLYSARQPSKCLLQAGNVDLTPAPPILDPSDAIPFLFSCMRAVCVRCVRVNTRRWLKVGFFQKFSIFSKMTLVFIFSMLPMHVLSSCAQFACFWGRYLRFGQSYNYTYFLGNFANPGFSLRRLPQ